MKGANITGGQSFRGRAEDDFYATLYNDDCFNVMKQIPNESVDLILTDPPYFVLPKGKNNDRFEWDNFQDLKSFLEFTSNWFTLALNKLKK